MSSTCKWDHIVFVFLCLAYFTQLNTLQVHLWCFKWQDFLLFCGRIIFHYEYIYMYIFAWEIYIHTTSYLSIHLLLDTWTLSLWLLAIVNNATTNVKGCRSLFKLLMSFLSGTYPEMRILDHMVVWALMFWGASMLFSMGVVMYVPPTVHKEPFRSTLSPALVTSCPFADSPFNRCGEIGHRGFG